MEHGPTQAVLEANAIAPGGGAESPSRHGPRAATREHFQPAPRGPPRFCACATPVPCTLEVMTRAMLLISRLLTGRGISALHCCGLCLLAAARLAYAQESVNQVPNVPMATVFEMSRAETHDLVILRTGQSLEGDLFEAPLSFVTEYGIVEVPLTDCAAIAFGRGRGRLDLLATNSSSLLSGFLVEEGLSFRPSGRTEWKLIPKEEIEVCVMRLRPPEGVTVPRLDLAFMANGDLLVTRLGEGTPGLPEWSRQQVSEILVGGARRRVEVLLNVNGRSVHKVPTDDYWDMSGGGIEIGRVHVSSVRRVVMGGQLEAPGYFRLAVDLGGGLPRRAVVPQDCLEARTNSIGMSLVEIPEGPFVMGGLRGDAAESPSSLIELGSAFWVSSTEVTRAQWYSVMGGTPEGEDGDLPMTQVTWRECREFCERLTDKERAAGLISPRACYDLPTEVQWERACYGSPYTGFAFFGFESDLGPFAWFDGNSALVPHGVAEKQPTHWGLFDMHGNVQEWCLDDSEGAGPLNVAAEGGPMRRRVAKGGSSAMEASRLRAPCRRYFLETAAFGDLGFRVVVSPVPR
jgi:formylglycine-generating enzyme required for sulfatase activity